MKSYSAKYWIGKFSLKPHPEGGFYKETLRSEIKHKENNSTDWKDLYTSIYYLLAGSDFSAFHRLNSDEIWYYHYGAGNLEIITIIDENNIKIELLGIGEDAEPFILIPKGYWFAARLQKTNSYILTSCVVSPGFDFNDFELAKKDELINLYPGFEGIITSLTR